MKRNALKDLVPWLLLAALTMSWMLDRRTAPVPAASLTAVVAAEAAPADSGAVFALTDLVAQLDASERSYLPFLTRPSLRAGLYALAAGAEDRQQPHAQDEVYYVLAGHSAMTLGDAEFSVAPGDVIYVPAQAAHRFHTITEDLQMLVFFSEAAPSASRQ